MIGKYTRELGAKSASDRTFKEFSYATSAQIAHTTPVTLNRSSTPYFNRPIFKGSRRAVPHVDREINANTMQFRIDRNPLKYTISLRPF